VTVSDVTSERDFDEIYQNGSKPRLVVISVKFILGSANVSYATVYVGATSPPTLERSLVGFLLANLSGQGRISSNAVFLVQPYYYYTVTEAGVGVEIEKWIEHDLEVS
jgi:hypothetical protein